jgi:hypothetical protein
MKERYKKWCNKPTERNSLSRRVAGGWLWFYGAAVFTCRRHVKWRVCSVVISYCSNSNTLLDFMCDQYCTVSKETAYRLEDRGSIPGRTGSCVHLTVKAPGGWSWYLPPPHSFMLRC